MIDDALLMAYLDGELDAAEQARVAQAVANDPALQQQLETQRALRDRLRAHYDPVAEEEVPVRLRALLEPEIVDLDTARARRARPVWQALAAIAASLAIGIFVGRSLPVGVEGPVTTRNGVLVAQGDLAQALDTQLASAQPGDAATRIGVSFARADGAFCRTFEGPALSGLACREGARWHMVMTAAGSGGRQGDYRQAGNASARIAETAQDLMAGEPLDAAGERRARDRGWR
jgi:hypothetical protein